MALQENRPLINIGGRVYRLSKKEYEHFHKELEEWNKVSGDPGFLINESWGELLRWVEEHGKYVCRVETYNY